MLGDSPLKPLTPSANAPLQTKLNLINVRFGLTGPDLV
jgi:hypothetical protein